MYLLTTFASVNMRLGRNLYLRREIFHEENMLRRFFRNKKWEKIIWKTLEKEDKITEMKSKNIILEMIKKKKFIVDWKPSETKGK